MKSSTLVAIAAGCSVSVAPLAFPAVIINEYLYDPAPNAAGDANKDTIVDISQDEFIEFVNTGASPVDMSGWTIRDAVALRHTFPGGTVLGPGCAIVVFGGGHPPINLFGGAIVQVASTGLLGRNNDGDTLTLLDSGAVVMDSVTYGNAGNVDKSFTRSPDLTGPFVAHDIAAGSGGTLFSPGRRVDGTPFGSCVAPGPDFDGDGHPDKFDNCIAIANPSQADCDGNGIGDVCDIADDPSQDCNLNGIVDDCEVDCNQSGFPDDCDITLGISQDCNGNGIPDECEADCNQNGIADPCDIASGFSVDTNLDGIPDECQNTILVVINEVLADPPTGPSGDANHDGATSATEDEFVEIVNGTANPVSIAGWTLRDAQGGGIGTIRHTFPAGTTIPSNCGIIVFGGGTPIGQFNGMQKQKASTGALSLNNDGDTITLRDSTGLLVSTITYGGTSGLNGGDDQSLTRKPDITGAFLKHTAAQAGILFSPGSKFDGTAFGGCPPVLLDSDGDGIPDVTDNCDFVPNPFQADCDNDGIGDACDTDPDANGNGIPDICEIGVPGNVRINEIRIDQPNTDNDEYLEIKGPPGLSLNGLTYIVLGDPSAGGAASGAIELIIPLAGQVIPPDGHFVACENTTTLVPAAQRDLVLGATGINFENSDNVTHMLVTNFTGTLNQDIDSNDDGIPNPTGLPWSAVVDAVALVGTAVPGSGGYEYPYGAAFGGTDVGPDGLFVPGHVYRCETAGTWLVGPFDPILVPTPETPGTINPATCAACAGDIAPAGGNGVVNIDDLLLVINSWGACAGCVADVTPAGGNSVVNIDDLLFIINHWGACP